MIPFVTSPTIDRATTEYEASARIGAELAAKRTTYRAELEALAQSIPDAVAEGDGALLTELRQKRGELEAELRDLDAGMQKREARTLVARREQARTRYPAMAEAVRAATERFNTLIDEANRLSSAIKTSQNACMQEWNAGELGGLESPDHWRRIVPFTPIAGVVYRAIADTAA